MKAKRLVVSAALALALPAAAVALVNSSSVAAVIQDPDDPFVGPWSEASLETAVAGPREALDKGDLTEAERRVQRLLDGAPDAAERSRLATAWAIALMIHHSDKGDPLPWLRRAAEEARLGYPGDSRLLAMALGDYGTFESERLGAATSPEAEAALAEASAIQGRRLGAGHVEALATTVALGKLRGHPGRTEGDPARLDAASRLFERLLTADRPAEDGDLNHFFLDWTRMLIANRRPDAACAVLEKLPSIAPHLRLSVEFIGYQTGLSLREAGYSRQAEPLIGDARFFSPASKPNNSCGI